MIFRYKADHTKHKAWLRHPRHRGTTQEMQVVVKAYGTDIVVLERWEAEHDFEIVSATRQELERLRKAGYNVAFASSFHETEP